MKILLPILTGMAFIGTIVSAVQPLHWVVHNQDMVLALLTVVFGSLTVMVHID